MTTDAESEWGLFPKVVNNTLKAMEGKKFYLQIQAMEFYICQCFDLLDPAKKGIRVDHNGVCASTSVRIEKIEDLSAVLQMIFKQRVARATKMNQADKSHTGSSRSHAALILTLYQLIDKEYQKTEFHLVDLAGAERPDKAGGERSNGTDVMMALQSGKPLEIGQQGFLINFELTGIGQVCIDVTDAHRKGKKVQAPRAMTPPLIFYMFKLLDGGCVMNMIICLSLAPQNGWETWFSLQFGQNLNKLAVKIPQVQLRNLVKALKEATSQEQEFKKKCEGPVTKNTPVFKEFHRRALYEV